MREQALAVADLSLLALSPISLADLLDRVAARVTQTLAVDYCRVLELQSSGTALLVRAGVGWKEGVVGRMTIPVEDTHAGYALRSQEPVIVDDLATEDRFHETTLLRDHRVVSGVGIIIPGQHQPYGLLSIYTVYHRVFTTDEVHFVQTIAAVLAEAIARRQSERYLEAIVTLEHMADGVTTQADMLAAILDTLQPLLGTDGTTVIAHALGQRSGGRGQRSGGKDRVNEILTLEPRPMISQRTSGFLSRTAISAVVANVIQRVRLHERTAELVNQLHNRESFIARIVESTPSSLVVFDRALRVVLVNRNFLEKSHREKQSTQGHRVEEIFPQVLLEYTRLDQKLRAVFRSGQAIDGDKLAYRAPGVATHIYYYRLIPLKIDGRVENVLLFMDDITERERLGEEIRRVERHLASVVESANDLVLSVGVDGAIMTWNRAAERVSGLSAERARGRMLLSLCPISQRPAMAAMLDALRRGAATQQTEINLLTTQGQEVPIAWNCSPMLTDAGDVAGIVAIGRDLTDQRRLEAQLIQSDKMASLGVMAGGIAHELRNPLGIISANAQLLQDHQNDTTLRGACTRKIHDATKRASLIIENLLKFARPMSAQMQLIDVNAVLEDTFVLMTHQFAVQQIRLTKQLAPDLSWASGNPALLQQVFTNLILNACNAMLQGGRLTVITRARGTDRIEILVEDNGCGITPEVLPKIFDPFFTTRPIGKGTGLGLSISYSIIQQHHGEIAVQSTVGQGSTFTVVLPSVIVDRDA